MFPYNFAEFLITSFTEHLQVIASAFTNEEKLKWKFPDNLGQNICRLFHVLAVFPRHT